jgi:hypothetical protein
VAIDGADGDRDMSDLGMARVGVDDAPRRTLRLDLRELGGYPDVCACRRVQPLRADRR